MEEQSDTLVLTTPKTANPSLVQITIEDYARELFAKSKDYSEKIKTAKTKPKAEFYKKKLKKNNHELFRCMMGLQRIARAKPKPDNTPWKIIAEEGVTQYGEDLVDETTKTLTEEIENDRCSFRR